MAFLEERDGNATLSLPVGDMTEMSGNMRERIRKAIAPAVAGLVLAAALGVPGQALAATLTITPTTDDGSTPPAATITVKKTSDNSVVKEIQFPGGADAKVDPIDVNAGEELLISATANGYFIQAQKGTPNESGANVKLVARKATTVTVQLKADGVTDFSGVTAKLYKGGSATGNPQTSVQTDASGLIKFDNVPAGSYTVALDLPAALQSKLPATQQVDVPSNPQQPVSVTMGNAPAASNVNADAGASNVNGSGTTSSEGISQTGDRSGGALLGIAGAATVTGLGIVMARRVRG